MIKKNAFPATACRFLMPVFQERLLKDTGTFIKNAFEKYFVSVTANIENKKTYRWLNQKPMFTEVHTRGLLLLPTTPELTASDIFASASFIR